MDTKLQAMTIHSQNASCECSGFNTPNENMEHLQYRTMASSHKKGYRYRNQQVLVFSNKIKSHENLNKKTVTSTGSVVDPNNLNIWIRIQGYVFNLEKIVMKI